MASYFYSRLALSFLTGAAWVMLSTLVSEKYGSKVSGLINVPVYALVVRLVYPWAGLAFGTVIALLVAVGSGYMTY